MPSAADRLVRLAALAQASAEWDAAVTLEVASGIFEVQFEEDALDEELPRLRGSDLLDVLDRAVERAESHSTAAADDPEGPAPEDVHRLDELLTEAVERFGPGGFSLGYVPRSRVVQGPSWEVIATAGAKVSVWTDDGLDDVLRAWLGEG